jgi:hypothetical protein
MNAITCRDGRSYRLSSYLDLPLAMAVITGAAQGKKIAEACTSRGWYSADVTPDAVRAALTFAAEPAIRDFLDVRQFPQSYAAVCAKHIPGAKRFLRNIETTKEAA